MSRVAKAVLCIVALIHLSHASDPCFSLQTFGHGFDVVVDGGNDPVDGVGVHPPRLEAGRVVVHVRAGSCTGVDFQAQVQHHGSRNGLCSTWLELVHGSECVDNVGMDDLGRTTRRVSVPLPRDIGNCSTVLFAFPPGQQYEYYNLVLPAAVAGNVYGSTRSAVDVLVARHALDHDLLREQEAQPTSMVGSTDLIHKVAEMNMNRTAVEDPKITCCHDDLAHVSARS
eukprot:CAMPEP_0177406524 /NCGR_PEP_ID=MMETSP0368-20130122/62608_1 /TAXON_ID=447022 ORGANISM="Scrippsiella hangoei-like, Strain SHHI-4" /NCGR_SAMPLE_ID=MMETSP0368 /ASSEMBLY_ACC=CAM_ASM_000363 /LENGTH=226 /DNA_ID=CAMNT_0018874935 /DNA_START=35 /DNA_END=715 /DNA_ORIENTATION=+